MICIDDFAFKKRYSYGTIMVDLASGRIIDILNSRETVDVVEWLKSYPQIKYVSRDGSQSYRAAINKAFPKAVQISDRFHLVKNLSEALVMFINRIIKGRIEIPITSETIAQRNSVLNKSSLHERYIIAQSLYRKGKTISEISSILKISEKTVSKYINTKESDIPPERIHSRKKELNISTQKRSERADIVQNLRSTGMGIRRISRETGYSETAVRNYLSDDFNSTNGQYGLKRSGKLTPYIDDVLIMLSNGFTYEQAAEKIRKKGYNGTTGAIRNYINKERRITKDISSSEQTELVDRKWLKSLIFKHISKVKGITMEQLNAVMMKYPQIKTAYDLISNFKKIIFSRHSELLDEWITTAFSLGIDEINSFLNGIYSDIDAVKNSIDLEYNNGLAEGSVNKIKVVKRIMYGRCSFDIFKKKILLLSDFYSKF